MRLVLLTKLVLASEIDVWTKSQTIKPLNANKGYGTSFVSNRANVLKITVKISVVSAGCRTAHATPISVCLYRIFISRSVRKYSSSRYFHISARSSDAMNPPGRIVVTCVLSIMCPLHYLVEPAESLRCVPALSSPVPLKQRLRDRNPKRGSNDLQRRRCSAEVLDKQSPGLTSKSLPNEILGGGEIHLLLYPVQ